MTNNTIEGSAGSDKLAGTIGDDLILGKNGNDTIGGGIGDDIIEAGLGNDILWGETGSDTFVYSSVGQLNDDWIMDFSAGDILDLSAIKNLRFFEDEPAGTIKNDWAATELSPVAWMASDGSYLNVASYVNTSRLYFKTPAFFEQTTPTSGLFKAVGGIDNTLDLIAPEKPYIDPIDEINIADKDAGVMITGTAEPESTILLTLSYSDNATTKKMPLVDTSYLPIEIAVGADTFWAYALMAEDYQEGKLTITVVARDEAGNVSVAAEKIVTMNISNGLTKVGDAKNNTLIGADENDNLSGLAGNDSLLGKAGSDTLIGGLGKDTLTGGGGTDIFKFNNAKEPGTNAKTCDIITDFKHKEGDKIDLSAIDPNVKLPGDQSFKFIGNKGFSKEATAELHFDTTSHILYGSTNADNKPEFAIQLNGVTNLVVSDFVL